MVMYSIAENSNNPSHKSSLELSRIAVFFWFVDVISSWFQLVDQTAQLCQLNFEDVKQLDRFDLISNFRSLIL